MNFKIEKSEASTRFPQFSIFMGLPKIGKSTKMAELPKALILDLEMKGYDEIDAAAVVKVPNTDILYEVTKYFFSKENTDSKFLVIDHLRMLSSFYTDRIIKENDVRFIEEVGYGKGNYQLKNELHRFLRRLKTQLGLHPDKYVVIVAHASDRNNEIRLDVDGKNESIVLGEVDSVGFISRDADKVTNVSFGSRRGVEFGTRNKYLANYSGPFEWQTLFKVSKGEQVK